MSKFKNSFIKLKSYCEAQQFKGWDPFDGLNSKLFNVIPFVNKSKLLRLAWLQAFKRNPLNFRALTGVAKEYNTKGLGLFLTSYCNLYLTDPKEEYLEKIHFFSKLLLKMQVKGYSGSCWGYNFNWQARAFFQPKNTPTVVATSFISSALFSAYEITNEKAYLNTALSASEFIVNDLNKTVTTKGIAFSYSPLDSTQVLNATLLAVRQLSESYKYNSSSTYLDYAKKGATYVCSHQKKDGSWPYGSLPYHQWVDSFHTGYNLECLGVYQQISKDLSFNSYLEKGLEYYINNFFTAEGASKYYNNSLYPIDIHAPAQLIVTLSKLNVLNKHKKLVDSVLNWTIDNMQSKDGSFYYQKRKYYTNKIPYMRWTQAWMFYGFSFYIKNTNE